LWARHLAAAVDARDLAGVRDVLAALARVDRWDPRARVGLLVLADADAGRGPADVVLVGDAVEVSSLYGASVRLERAISAHPRALGLRLGLAWRAVDMDATADARVLLAPVLADAGATAEVRELAALLVAMCDLRDGDLDAWERWRAGAAGSEASPALAAVELEVAGWRPAGPRMAALGGAAARRALARGWSLRGAPRHHVALLVASDATAPAADRQAALAELAPGDDPDRAIAEHCLERQLGTETCRKRLALVDDIVGGGEGEGAPGARALALRQLADVPDLPADWLWPILEVEAAEAASLAPLVRSYDGTRLAASEPYAVVRVAVEIAAGDAGGAEAALARHGALVSLRYRVWLRLAVDDLRARRARPAQIFASFRWPSASWDMLWRADAGRMDGAAQRELEQRYPGPAYTAHLARGLAAWDARDAATALVELAPLVKVLDGPEGGEVAGWVALLALRVGDAARFEATRSRLDALAPRGAPALFLRVMEAWSDKDHAAAQAGLAELLRLHPDAVPALSDLANALGEAYPGADGARRVGALVETLGAQADWMGFVATHVRGGALASGADVVEVLDALGDGERCRKLLPARAGIGEVAECALGGVEAAVAAATPAEARRIAAGAAPLIAASAAAGPQRDALAWLWFVAGDGGKAAALVADEPWTGLASLAPARAALGDAVALDAWRHFRFQDGDGPALARALVAAAPGERGAQATACLLLVEADQADEAAAPCWAAFTSGPLDAVVATRTSWVVVNARDSALPRGASLDALRTRCEAELPADDGAWLFNVALGLGRRGRHQEAATLMDEAWAQGWVPEFDPGGELHAAQLAYRARALRLWAAVRAWQEDLGPGPKHLRLTWWALEGGDLEVARRHQRAAVTWAGAAGDATLLGHALDVGDLVAVAEHDLAAGTLDAAGVRELYFLGTREAGAGDYEALRKRRPGSILVAISTAEELFLAGRLPEAALLARQAWQALPGNLVIGHTLVRVLVAQGQNASAREVVAEVRRRNPGDARLAELAAPSGPDAPRVPDWAATAEGFGARLAAVTPAALMALGPVRHASLQTGAELTLPRGFVPGKELMPGKDADGAALGVFSTPRDSFCEGERCLAPIVDVMRDQGLPVQWEAPLSLPAGPAHAALLAGQNGVVLVASLPAGGRTLVLMATAPHGQLEQKLPAIRLLLDGARPLDAVRPARQAETLRARAGALGDDARFAARQALAVAPAGAGCPLPAELGAGVAAATRGALLVDLLLATADPARRRALVACVTPDEEAAAAAALPALLDDDAAVHAWGARATRAFPARVVEDARAVLTGPDETAVAAQVPGEDALPPYGLVEVLLALPPAERQTLAGELAAGKDRRGAWLALLTPALAPDALPRELLRERVRSAPAAEAHVAVLALDEDKDAADAAALRARYDALKAPLSPEERLLAADILATLWDVFAPEDAARFERAPALLTEGAPAAEKKRAEGLAEAVRARAEGHAAALRLARGEKPTGRVGAWASAAAHRLAVRKAETVTGRFDAALLAKTPLARLLPGGAWIFARVGQPGLFAATAAELGGRLRGAADQDTEMARRVAENARDDLAGRFFGAEGGLDLTRPIECAAPGSVGTDYVCTATVRDAAAVEAALLARAPGNRSGVTLPLPLATNGIGLPLVLAAAPVLVHWLIDLDDGGGGEKGARVAQERARSTIEIRGVTLSRATLVEAWEKAGAEYDSEVWIIAGDTLWLFSSADMARVVLAGPPARGKALADVPRFKKAAAAWRDLGSLQALALAGDLLQGNDTEFEVVASSTGVRFVMLGGEESDEPDVGAVAALLPDGAASSLAFARAGGEADTWLDDDLAVVDIAGPAPPLWLAGASSLVAFGWYPDATTSTLWQRWIGVVRFDDRVRRACGVHGVTLPASGQVGEHGGLAWAVRGDVLVVGTPRALVDEALARRAPAPPAAGARRTVFSGNLDGARAATALFALGKGLRAGDARGAPLRFAAALVSTMRTVRFAAWLEPRTKRYRLEAEVVPNLAESGAETRVVDRWLESRSIRNSARLPRKVSRAELERTVVLEVEVENARVVAERAFPPSPRVKVQVLDDHRLRVEIAPGPRLDQPVEPAPVGDAERARLTRTSGPIVADTPEMRALARSVVPEGTAPAQAAALVNAWVHQRLRYEITPESLDAPTILARGRGDCTEFSILTVSLLRALGIPAELREGMALDGDELVAHAWVAFHDGTGWRELEPTWGLTFVDSGHVETSVVDFVGLVSLEQLEITKVTTTR
jgi:transglutaminase-like putative cysteine protease